MKPTLWPVFLPVTLVLIYIGLKNRIGTPRNTIVRYFSILLIGIMSISFQLGMMKKDFGIYTLSFNGKKTLYEFIGSFASSIRDKANLSKIERARVETMNSFIENKQWQKIDSISDADRNDQLKNNTRNYLKALRIDIEINTFSPGTFAIANNRNWPFFDLVENACIWLSYWQNVLFTEFGVIGIFLIMFIRKRLGNKTIIVAFINWGIIMFIIVISGISFWQLNRFHVVLTPLVLINAGLLFASATKKPINT